MRTSYFSDTRFSVPQNPIAVGGSREGRGVHPPDPEGLRDLILYTKSRGEEGGVESVVQGSKDYL